MGVSRSASTRAPIESWFHSKRSGAVPARTVTSISSLNGSGTLCDDRSARQRCSMPTPGCQRDGKQSTYECDKRFAFHVISSDCHRNPFVPALKPAVESESHSRSIYLSLCPVAFSLQRTLGRSSDLQFAYTCEAGFPCFLGARSWRIASRP
jgi:hypothetical protein